jgi:four helix bundle protein
MRNDKDNVIVTKTIDFSVSIIEYCEALEQDRKFVIAKQLLRSATSIGANVFEAQNAESKADFIHKMKIAAKEASETQYWLILCERSKNYKFEAKLKSDLEDIIRILSKIIASSKGKIPRFIWSLLYSFSNFQILKLAHL